MLSAIQFLLLSAALCVVMLFVLASLARSGIAGVRAWAGANMLAVAAMLLFAARGRAPGLLSVELANLLLALSITSVHVGFCRFFGRRLPVRLLLAGLTAMMAGVAYFHYITESISARTVVVSVFHGSICLAIGMVIWQAVNSARSRYAYHFTAVVALLLAVGHLVRGTIYALRLDTISSSFQPTGWNLVFLAIGTMVLPVLTMGAVMMVHERMMAQAEDMANRDYLTGAWNRRALFRSADREMLRERRTGRRLSVLVLDVDHFKRINDSHGHAQGDRVLIDLVRQAGAMVRGFDCFARLGGEEFALLLPETDAAAALHAAERLRAALQRSLPAEHGNRIAYTVSIGVATLENGESFSNLLGRADAALYAAKQAGRNTVRVAESAQSAQSAQPAQQRAGSDGSRDRNS
jgi:diguanylate cyclase (GGDEF)-like protein